MIYLIRDRATQEQTEEMLQTLETYIKLAVDIDRRVLTGGGFIMPTVNWKLRWANPEQQMEVAEQAKIWSDRILERSRLLD